MEGVSNTSTTVRVYTSSTGDTTSRQKNNLLAALLEKTALAIPLPSYFNFNPTGETKESRRKFL
jgi:hypothetical protein